MRWVAARNGQALPTSADYPTPAHDVFGYRAPTGGSIDNYGVMRSTINSLLNITFTKNITSDLNLLAIVGNEFNNSQNPVMDHERDRFCCTRLAEYVEHHNSDS